MTMISLTDLKNNTGKYVEMATREDVFITKHGKVVAKLATAKADKKASWERLTNLFAGANIKDEDVVSAREERHGW